MFEPYIVTDPLSTMVPDLPLSNVLSETTVAGRGVFAKMFGPAWEVPPVTVFPNSADFTFDPFYKLGGSAGEAELLSRGSETLFSGTFRANGYRRIPISVAAP
jgi:hypothetical protein